MATRHTAKQTASAEDKVLITYNIELIFRGRRCELAWQAIRVTVWHAEDRFSCSMSSKLNELRIQSML